MRYKFLYCIVLAYSNMHCYVQSFLPVFFHCHLPTYDIHGDTISGTISLSMFPIYHSDAMLLTWCRLVFCHIVCLLPCCRALVWLFQWCLAFNTVWTMNAAVWCVFAALSRYSAVDLTLSLHWPEKTGLFISVVRFCISSCIICKHVNASVCALNYYLLCAYYYFWLLPCCYS